MDTGINKIAIWCLTKKACQLGERCARKMPEAVLFVPTSRASDKKVRAFDDFSGCLKREFHDFKEHLFIMATGIVVRSIAPLLKDKGTDPAVVVMDELGEHIISLISGHLGGANRLAHRLFQVIGANPVITTATDLAGILAFDSLAAEIGARVENLDKIKLTSSCQLNSLPVALVAEPDLVRRYYKDCRAIVAFDAPDNESLKDFEAVCIISEKTFPLLDKELLAKALIIRPSVLVVGIGCNRGTRAEEIEQAVRAVFQENNLSLKSVFLIASVDKKASEAGLLEFSAEWAIKIKFWKADELNSVSDGLFSPPSEQALHHLGIIGVAEPAALLAAGERAELVVSKRRIGNVTVAVAKSKLRYKHEGKLFLVGIGPGNADYMTIHARRLLKISDVVVGYTSYIKLLADLIEGKRIIATGMTREIDRVIRAVEEAAAGKTVSLVCSGDTGVYGLAGLVYETLETMDLEIEVEISPGVTAAVSAAALVGAPLTNDYITISLSDLLTPTGTVISRIRSAAASGMVTAVYNPKSKKRTGLIKLLQEEFLKYRKPDTPVAVVSHALRPGERTVVSDLAGFLEQEIGMNSLVIIGNRDTLVVNGRMVTRRGYEQKHGTHESGAP
ncbi:MAG: precorrin-3B C(17)-methyltransferase [bacterium]